MTRRESHRRNINKRLEGLERKISAAIANGETPTNLLTSFERTINSPTVQKDFWLAKVWSGQDVRIRTFLSFLDDVDNSC